MKDTGYLALKCLECGMISVFPSRTADGTTCLDCEGYTVPIGYAMIKKPKVRSITVAVSADVSEINNAIIKLNEAATKAKELKDLLRGIAETDIIMRIDTRIS